MRILTVLLMACVLGLSGVALADPVDTVIQEGPTVEAEVVKDAIEKALQDAVEKGTINGHIARFQADLEQVNADISLLANRRLLLMGAIEALSGLVQ